MSDTAAKPPRMTVEEFIDWSETHPGRHELFMGEVVTMQAERALHNLVKLSVAIAFREQLKRNGIACTAFTDGVVVKIDRDTAFEPDVSIDCGKFNPDSVFVTAPVVIGEVISPSTSRIDSGRKFSEYFRVPSVQHYLIIQAERRVVVHHRRSGASIESRILGEGDLVLDPPGITVAVADFFADLALDQV